MFFRPTSTDPGSPWTRGRQKGESRGRRRNNDLQVFCHRGGSRSESQRPFSSSFHFPCPTCGRLRLGTITRVTLRGRFLKSNVECRVSVPYTGDKGSPLRLFTSKVDPCNGAVCFDTKISRWLSQTVFIFSGLFVPLCQSRLPVSRLL